MDYIEIKNLNVFAKHGVLPEERTLGQHFYIDAKLGFDVESAGVTDNLEKTVNYAEICDDIVNWMSNNSLNLIEAVAENLVQMIFRKYTRIQEISLTVNKPSAPISHDFKNVSVTVNRKRHIVYISLGSNLGDRDDYLRYALETLEDCPVCHISKISDFIETDPVGYTDQPQFLNAVAEVETTLEPQEFLIYINSIEADAKRERTIHWGPRTLDIDIILWDDEIIHTRDLIIPHPEMLNRQFVLKPLAQIAPYAYIPTCGKYAKDFVEE